jgi:hypothetical protein
MPITFTCRCGNVLRTAEANVGKPGKCPACSTSFIVPPANGSGLSGAQADVTDYPLRRVNRQPVRHDNRFDGLTSDDVQLRPRLDEEDEEQKAERRRHRAPNAAEFAEEEPEEKPLHWLSQPITLAAIGVFLMILAGVWFRVQLERGIIVMQAPVVFAAGLILGLVGALRYFRQKNQRRR